MDGIKARLGIGNASVDLVVPVELTQGETETATVEIEGGDVEQEVEGVYGKFCTLHENCGRTVATVRFIDESFTIAPDESRTIETEFEVPRDAPVTTLGGHVTMWIDTGLEIDMAVDPDDRDYVEVAPGAEFEAVHRAMIEELGFEFHSIETDEYAGIDTVTTELEYRPEAGSEFDGRYREVDLLTTEYDPEEGLGIELEAEGEEAGGVLATEDRDRLRVDTTDPAEVAPTIHDVIDG